jgi:phosphoribosylformylglycinamidine synthase
LAATTDCNGRYVHLDPYEGAKAAVAEAARNISCVGAEPVAITDNLNFGSPEKPVGYWQLASACRGIAEACEALQTPVTGGNVSLYNETLDANNNPTPIYPTPVVGMVGMVEDITQACQLGWQTAGDAIYLLGYTIPNREQVTLGGSEYLATVHNTVAGKPPRIHFDLEKQVTQACRYGIRQGWVRSAHDCAEGGLAVALAEACIASGWGATVTLDTENSKIRPDELLFAEGGARILVSVPLSQANTWESYLQTQLETAWCRLGEVTNGNLQIVTKSGDSLLDITVKQMQTTYENAIARRL